MKNIFKAYLELYLVDELIAVSMAMNEISQMANIEKRLYELFVKSWEVLSDKAANDARALRVAGKSASEIIASTDKTMNAWAGAVGPIAVKELKHTYALGRRAGLKRASGSSKQQLSYPAPLNVPVSKAVGAFDMVDDAVVKSLNTSQMFWIGKFYEDGVSDGIVQVVKDNIIMEGVSPKVAGDLMAQKIRDGLNHVSLPTGWGGTSRQYMEGLTANAMTTARVHGQMRSFMEIGVSHYVISNPSDKRTCAQCAHMEGKTFTLKQGADQMQSDLGAKTPDAVRTSHPWISQTVRSAISPTPGALTGKAGEADSKALAAAGQALPTYHFKCRCTVDVDYENVDYDALIPMPMSVVPSPINRYETSKAWADSLDEQRVKEISDWTLNGYRVIRPYQLNGYVSSSQTAESIEQAITGMRESLTTAPHYKGKIMRGVGKVSSKDIASNFKIGNRLRNDAFSSWSKEERIAEKFALEQANAHYDDNAVLMELVTSKGTFDIEPLSKYQSEKEVLMEQGKMMKVVDVKKETIVQPHVTYNLYRVKLEEIL